MKDTEKVLSKGRRERRPVRVVVEREFIGEKTLPEAFIPVLAGDLQRKAGQIRTFDNNSGLA